jgi:hypothetical protein
MKMTPQVKNCAKTDLSSPSSVEGISLYNGHSIKSCGKMKQMDAIEYEF